MDNLTPSLNEQQIRENIDALQKAGTPNDQIQNYVDNYQRATDGTFTLKQQQTPAINEPQLTTSGIDISPANVLKARQGLFSPLGQMINQFNEGTQQLASGVDAARSAPDVRPEDIQAAYRGGGLGAGLAEAGAQVAKGATHAVANIGQAVGGAFTSATAPFAPLFQAGTAVGKAIGNAVPEDIAMKGEDLLRNNPSIGQNASDITGLSNLAIPEAVEKTAPVVTAVGSTLGKAGSAIGSKLHPIDALRGYADTKVKVGIQNDINELLKSTRSIGNKSNEALRSGANLQQILSDPQIFRGLKVANNKINPDEAISTLDSRIDTLLDAKRSILPEVDKIMPPTPRSVIRSQAIDYIENGTNSLLDKKATIERMDAQLNAYPERLTPSEIDSLRADMRGSARDAKGQLKSDSEYAALEQAARKTIFDITDNLPVSNASEYKALNDYTKHMITTKTFLDKTLRGQTVKGGKLGGYALRFLGTVAGASHGAIPAILGHAGGGVIADIITNNALGSSFKMSLIRNITDDPAIIAQAEKLLGNVKNVNQFRFPTLPQGKSKTIAGPTIRLGQGFTQEKSVPNRQSFPKKRQ